MKLENLQFKKYLTLINIYIFKKFGLSIWSKWIILVFFTTFCCNSNAQNLSCLWAINMGGIQSDIGKRLVVSKGGNVYVVGPFNHVVDFNPGTGTALSYSEGFSDVFLAKYNSRGEFLWVRSLGSPFADYGYSLALDSRENVYICGKFHDTMLVDTNKGVSSLVANGEYDGFIVKYTEKGEFIWAKNIGGSKQDEITDILTDKFDNVFVTGNFTASVNFNSEGSSSEILTSRGQQDVFLAKYDSLGKYYWAKNMGGMQSEYPRSIAIDVGGNVHIAGYSLSPNCNFDPNNSAKGLVTFPVGGLSSIFLAKYDSNGNYIWANGFGGPGFGISTMAEMLAVDSNGNVFIGGVFNVPVDFDPSLKTAIITPKSTDAFLAKYDLDGNYMWAKGFGEYGEELLHGLALDDQGSIYVCGTFDSIDFNPGAGGRHVKDADQANGFVAKFDNDGNFVLSGALLGSAAVKPYSIKLDDLGAVYITGGFYGGDIDFDPSLGTNILTNHGSSNIFALKLYEGCGNFLTLSRSVCDSFYYNGVTYRESGQYVHAYPSSIEGCDSLVTLDLNIKGEGMVNEPIKGHFCDSVILDGIIYFQSGIYVHKYINSTGCDSSIVYNITIGQSKAEAITEKACGSYKIGGTEYSATGVYTVRLTTSTGCDSIVILHLTIVDSIEAMISKSGQTLISSQASNYQWLYCDREYTAIDGESDRSFTPLSSGNYAVSIVQNNCTDTSDCVYVRIGESSIDAKLNKFNIYLFPNPTSGRFWIRSGTSFKNARIRVFNVLGQQLAEQTNITDGDISIDITHYAPSVYWVSIQEGEQPISIIKFVKE